MKPRALVPGDLISFVSPASALDREKLDFSIALLEGWGYRVRLEDHALDSWGLFAGTDADRAADLMKAFTDPEVAAVYCTRGGYGCARLFPYLDLDAMAASGKMFLGFSDITVLHTSLNKRGLPTVHAPMGLTLHTPREAWVYESLRQVFIGGNPIPDEAPKGKTLIPGVVEGEVSGGCMILMCDSLGTPESVDLTGKIVLIEDVDEFPHRVDAMLTHLINSGQLGSAAGLVIGEMTRTDEKADPTIKGTPWREIVKERVMPLGLPTVIDFPFGHGKQMLSLPQGIRARFDASAGTLEYLESLCR